MTQEEMEKRITSLENDVNQLTDLLLRMTKDYGQTKKELQEAMETIDKNFKAASGIFENLTKEDGRIIESLNSTTKAINKHLLEHYYTKSIKTYMDAEGFDE